MIDLFTGSEVELKKYGKLSGVLEAKKIGFPIFPYFYLLESEQDIDELLRKYPEQKNFYMRSDVPLGEPRVNIGGKNGDRESIKQYLIDIKKQSANGVALIYWNEGEFCKTYETKGTWYLSFKQFDALYIDYLGKGWDGTYLSHGAASHESYIIPWYKIYSLNKEKIRLYLKSKINDDRYTELRNARINDLIEEGISKEDLEKNIPIKYNGMNLDDIGDYSSGILSFIMKMWSKYGRGEYRDECTLIVQKQSDGPGELIVPEIIHSKRVKDFNNKKEAENGR